MKTLKPTRGWHIIYCTTELCILVDNNYFKIKYELIMWVEKLTIIIWFWIPAIDVERYIVFLR